MSSPGGTSKLRYESGIRVCWAKCAGTGGLRQKEEGAYTAQSIGVPSGRAGGGHWGLEGGITWQWWPLRQRKASACPCSPELSQLSPELWRKGGPSLQPWHLSGT